MPSLYVVATPIGNLEDITLRALRVLREVKLIAAEDTRKTRRLLSRYAIKTPMTSYFEHNKLSKLDHILDQLKDNDVALVSEAGMPGISDPGYELIVAAAKRGIPVVPVPGPSAVTAALAVSGLPTDRFTFVGFLPGRSAARRRALASLAGEPGTIIALEAPHRLAATLQDILDVLGDRPLAIGRELTKLHEEIYRGTVNGALAYFAKPRGEITLVIAGRPSAEKPTLTGPVEQRLSGLYHDGAKAKDAIAAVAAVTGLPRKELYKAWLRLGDKNKKALAKTG
ncbi:MAG: 16S rRNA (cytidine(1402)-2'-O)-methyltransferase [Chloroflexi bacterium RBG_13_57_8]|nr:MAG: 16S rRNA (cytidine(1402)-2'-O)-methyltransferase [Chloroflexi bacterium RBG_13_57_8]